MTHVCILKTIAAKLDIITRKRKNVKKNITFVNFVNAGESKHNTHKGRGILATVTDWKMTVDIQQCTSMRFPAEIAAIPDLVL